MFFVHLSNQRNFSKVQFQFAKTQQAASLQ